MFGFFKRRAANKSFVEDPSMVLSATFSKLEDAVKDDDELRRRYMVVAALAACQGALKDTYGSQIVENQSLAVALVEANAAQRHEDADELCDAVVKLVVECPPIRNAQELNVLFMIAPRKAKAFRDAARH